MHRDLKHTVDVRPVYHRKPERIKAHVPVCWLALLVIRVIENETSDTSGILKQTLWQLMAGQHRTARSTASSPRAAPPTNETKRVLDALNLKPPNVYLAIPRPHKA